MRLLRKILGWGFGIIAGGLAWSVLDPFEAIRVASGLESILGILGKFALVALAFGGGFFFGYVFLPKIFPRILGNMLKD